MATGTSPQLANSPTVEDSVLLESYQRLGSVWKVGQETGLSGQTVHKRLRRLGIKFTNPRITSTEKEIIRSYYDSKRTAKRGELNLDEFADSLGRSKNLVCRIAREMGLTVPGRPVSEERFKEASEFFRAWHEANEHPRGMLGKSHSPETKAKISEFSTRYWAEVTQDQLKSRAQANLETRRKNGTKPSGNNYSTAKRGYRADIRLNVRSSWEANYARLLNRRVADPEDPLERWEYEPDTFWFEKIKRGVRSYLPDFKLYEKGSEPYYVEVKGWMDAKSVTKLKRMKKYHPSIKVVLVDAVEYRRLEKAFGPLIAGWEFPASKTRDPLGVRRNPSVK